MQASLTPWQFWQATFRYRRDRWIHEDYRKRFVLNVNDKLAVNVTL